MKKHILLEIKDLQVGIRGKQPIIRGVDLTMYKGEVLGLQGASGSGKSLTALAILQALPPAIQILSGSIHWQNAAKANAIFQEPGAALNPVMQCSKQIVETVQAAHPDWTKAQLAAAVKTWAEAVRLSAETLEKYPHQLSGGQQQRVLIAMALASEAALIIADEPTTALDVKLQTEILDILTDLCTQNGRSLLLISHDTEVLQNRCDRILNMHKGRCPVHQAPTTGIERSIEDSNLPTVSLEVRIEKAQTKSPNTEPLLQVSHLSISYANASFFRLRQMPVHTVLKSISLTISEGEGLLVTGPSGSGKSSLARSLSLPNARITGEVRIKGQVCNLRPGQPVHPRVQMIWQDPQSSLNPRLTIGAHLQEVGRIHESLHLMPELLTRLGLNSDLLARYPGQISGGQKQRIAILRALLAKPWLLICDEITASVDEETALDILHIIKGLQNDGISIIFITHQRKIADSLGFSNCLKLT